MTPTPSSPTPTSPVDDGGPASVTLTNEQWEYIKRHEDERTKEVHRHNARALEIQTKALDAVSSANIGFRDLAAINVSSALLGSAMEQTFHPNEGTLKELADIAYEMADALLTARKGGGERV